MSTVNGLDVDHVDLGRLDDLVEFITRVRIAQSGRPLVARDQLVRMLDRPDFVAERDSLLLRDRGGALVGAEWIDSRFPFVHPRARGFVDPDRTGEGIGTAMLDWAAGVARSRLADAPPGARVALEAGVDAKHQPSVDLMTGYGMELTRYFLEMRIDFTGDTPEPQFPPELEVRTMTLGVDDEAIALAMDDAFRDHFGHVEQPIELVIEDFKRRTTGDDFDPTLWWIALDGNEVVAAVLCEPSVDGDDGIGYVSVLGVRRPCRGRGLAKALLHLAFHEFRKRGKTAATLHVDAANPTGAAALYESVGMRESERFAQHELELRPGKELAVR